MSPGSLLEASWHEKRRISANTSPVNRKATTMLPGRRPKPAKIDPSRIQKSTFLLLNLDLVWGSMLAPFWGPLGVPWGLLGASWVSLGASGGPLGCPFGPLGCLWGSLGDSRVSLGCLLEPLGCLLGPLWCLLGPLGCLLGSLGGPWGPLGCSWGIPWSPVVRF